MASLQQLCPAAALNRSLWFDTLVAFVPYRGRGNVEVEVPPLFGAGSDDAWLSALRGPAKDVLPRGGPGTSQGEEYREPRAAEPLATGAGRDAPGWDGPLERDKYMPMLVELAENLKQEAGSLDPRVQPGVQALADFALQKLDEVERIYERYDNFELATRKDARESAFSRWGKGAVRGPITLRDSITQIIAWSEPYYTLGQSVQNYLLQNLIQTFGAEGVDTSAVIGDANPSKWQTALRQVRDRDRSRIHRLFTEAAQALWCAQFGVAQSESYRANRGRSMVTSLAMADLPSSGGSGTGGGAAPADDGGFDFPSLDHLIQIMPPGGGGQQPPPGEEGTPTSEGPPVGDVPPQIQPTLPMPELEPPPPSRAPLFVAGGIALGGAALIAAGAMLRQPQGRF